MSSNGEEEGATGEDINRPRNDSESSKSSDEGADQGKRQKTDKEFTFQGVAASPPKFVSLEEIVSASVEMNKMALAHEIAVDKDFRLKKVEPKENSIMKQVKDTVHRAFWDIFASQLQEDPPNYSHALILLAEIKENLFSLLLPQHVKLREQISETLDIDLIRQQAEKGVLDFMHYAQYVIHLMSKLCAPARDMKIQELMRMTDTVAIFKGILETLELMILDWANFHITLIRPTLITNSVEYEKKKFIKYLEVTPDGLECTRKWLLRHYNRDNTAANITALTGQVVADAYIELMDWQESNPYPETLIMDEARFRELGERYRKLSVCGAVLLVTATNVPALQGVASFKATLKTNVNTIMQDIRDQQSIERLIPSVADQVLKDVTESLAQHGNSELDETTSRLIEGQIKDIAKPDHTIRQLVQRRIREFLHTTITSPTAAPLRIPPGLSSLDTELTSLTGQFLRLVSHNRAVFGEFYTNIVAAAVDRPQP